MHFILTHPYNNFQTQDKPSTENGSHEDHQVDDEVEDNGDETEEEKEVDDSTYETEEEPYTETESDEDDDSDNNQPTR